ncbi:hypothetical protein PVAND_012851 [Polypedilum vanderplanki]|uniref:C2H2-type domain-containing protein n=1 Tax=Polypedilum vanderplanki TaxID=319348 RepID=A0A9J6CMQ8_POLVA|nr:hypothetical protein PVAND_012851 [Polypedilum vanderplanki]
MKFLHYIVFFVLILINSSYQFQTREITVNVNFDSFDLEKVSENIEKILREKNCPKDLTEKDLCNRVYLYAETVAKNFNTLITQQDEKKAQSADDITITISDIDTNKFLCSQPQCDYVTTYIPEGLQKENRPKLLHFYDLLSNLKIFEEIRKIHSSASTSKALKGLMPIIKKQIIQKINKNERIGNLQNYIDRATFHQNTDNKFSISFKIDLESDDVFAYYGVYIITIGIVSGVIIISIIISIIICKTKQKKPSENFAMTSISKRDENSKNDVDKQNKNETFLLENEQRFNFQKTKIQDEERKSTNDQCVDGENMDQNDDFITFPYDEESEENEEEDDDDDEEEENNQRKKSGRKPKKVTTFEEKVEQDKKNCLWKLFFRGYECCVQITSPTESNIKHCFSIYKNEWIKFVVIYLLDIDDFRDNTKRLNKETMYDKLRPKIANRLHEIEWFQGRISRQSIQKKINNETAKLVGENFRNSLPLYYQPPNKKQKKSLNEENIHKVIQEINDTFKSSRIKERETKLINKKQVYDQNEDQPCTSTSAASSTQNAYVTTDKKENVSRILRASWDQGNLNVFPEFGGTQCFGMVLANIVRAAILPPSRWTKNILDENMIEGDRIFAQIHYMTRDNAQAFPIDKCGYLSIKNLDIIKQDFIMYDNAFALEYDDNWLCAGSLQDNINDGVISHTLLNAIRMLFIDHNAGVLVCASKSLGLMHYDDKYYFTDSHSCGPAGASAANGTACIIECDTIEELHRIVRRALPSQNVPFVINYIDVIHKVNTIERNTARAQALQEIETTPIVNETNDEQNEQQMQPQMREQQMQQQQEQQEFMEVDQEPLQIQEPMDQQTIKQMFESEIEKRKYLLKSIPLCRRQYSEKKTSRQIKKYDVLRKKIEDEIKIFKSNIKKIQKKDREGNLKLFKKIVESITEKKIPFTTSDYIPAQYIDEPSGLFGSFSNPSLELNVGNFTLRPIKSDMIKDPVSKAQIKATNELLNIWTQKTLQEPFKKALEKGILPHKEKENNKAIKVTNLDEFSVASPDDILQSNERKRKIWPQIQSNRNVNPVQSRRKVDFSDATIYEQDMTKKTHPRAQSPKGYEFPDSKNLIKLLETYELNKMKESGKEVPTTDDIDKQCPIVTCKRISYNKKSRTLCLLHKAIIRLMMKKTWGLKCRVIGCNNKGNPEKLELCGTCSLVDISQRRPIVPIQNAGEFSPAQIRRMVYSDFQTRVIPYVREIIVYHYPEKIKFEFIRVYDGITKAGLIKRLIFHDHPDSYTKNFFSAIRMNVFDKLNDLCLYEELLTNYIIEIFGITSVLNKQRGGLVSSNYAENFVRGENYLLIYFDREQEKERQLICYNFFEDYNPIGNELEERKEQEIWQKYGHEIPLFNSKLTKQGKGESRLWAKLLGYDIELIAGLGTKICQFPYCEKSYSRSNNLRNHQDKEKHFYCNYENCGGEDEDQVEIFASRELLEAHYESVHEFHKCPCCNKNCRNVMSMLSHLRQSAKTNGVCIECGNIVVCKEFVNHMNDEHDGYEGFII